MIKYYVTPATLLFLTIILFSGCKKSDWCTGETQSKHLQLKELTWTLQHTAARSYKFYYNNRNAVDSVRVTEPGFTYLYNVYYTNDRIDSVALINSEGIIESVNTEIKYSGNRITGYTYYYRGGESYPFPHTFEYDNKDRIQTIDSVYQLAYDDRNNVIRSNLFSNTSHYATYAHDTQLNPLYYVTNLFVIFVEEPYIWEYEFSQHNTVSKTIDNQTETHKNEYNAQQQLIKKTIYNSDESVNQLFTFSYYP